MEGCDPRRCGFSEPAAKKADERSRNSDSPRQAALGLRASSLRKEARSAGCRLSESGDSCFTVGAAAV